MTPLKWFASFLVIGLLFGAAFFFFRSGELPQGTILSKERTAGDVAVREEAEDYRKSKHGKRVEELYEKESKRVGSVDPDPKLTQQRLSAMAAELSAEEIDWLARRALDTRSEGDARFFAAYLLALAPAELSVAALRAIALSPVPEHKNTGLVEQERLIRAQAVEGLSRARGVAAARDALLDVVEQQPDDFLRDRSHRGLHAWQTGKPVEEQDHKALGKLLYEGKK